MIDHWVLLSAASLKRHELLVTYMWMNISKIHHGLYKPPKMSIAFRQTTGMKNCHQMMGETI